MKKFVCLLLVALLLCGCTAQNPADTGAAEDPTLQETQGATAPTFEAVENPVKYFSLSMGEDYENVLRMDVFFNEDGTVHVEYVGKEKKVGDVDANIVHGISAAFSDSGLQTLNGQDAYEEGEANASMYVEMEDSTVFAAGFSGKIPQTFRDGFAKMDQFFASATDHLPVYVPQPIVLDEVEEALLNPTLDIISNSGIETPDAYTISRIAMDDSFAAVAGLSSQAGIAGGVSCAPMMMTSAYSLVIVKLDDAKAEDVCADFEKSLDWRKWVCVEPDKTMIAVKDDMVLCLMATEEAFNQTVTGITATGWTEVKTLERP